MKPKCPGRRGVAYREGTDTRCRPPNIFDLGTLGSRPGNRFNVPNADLKPESVWSYDLGIKSGGKHWEAELFLFYSDYRDKISSRFTGGLTPDGRFIVRSDNLGKVQLLGIESGFRYLFTDQVELYAVINYTRGEENEADGMMAPADRIPPLNGRVGFVFNPSQGLELGLRLENLTDKNYREHSSGIDAPGRNLGAWFNFLF